MTVQCVHDIGTNSRPQTPTNDYVFEGAEKKIEIDFVMESDFEKLIPVDGGLRVLPESYWAEVIASLGGSILMTSREKDFDAYLISESSLFVYSNMVIMLTCGRTRILVSIPLILDKARELGMVPSWFQFSRKNFLFPNDQPAPHSSFSEEVRHLKQLFPNGSPYVLGPLDSDHWLLFLSDTIDRSQAHIDPVDKDQMLNVYMYDIDQSVAKLFMKEHFEEFGIKTVEDVARLSGIDSLIEDGTISHQFLFDPCGYSMNGRCGEAYWTIHITPEAHCSYASLETNLPVASFHNLISRVLDVFRPRLVQTIEHIDPLSPLGIRQSPTPISNSKYLLRNRCVNEFTYGYNIQLCNYVVRAVPHGTQSLA